jgi:hypothetical protein
VWNLACPKRRQFRGFPRGCRVDWRRAKGEPHVPAIHPIDRAASWFQLLPRLSLVFAITGLIFVPVAIVSRGAGRERFREAKPPTAISSGWSDAQARGTLTESPARDQDVLGQPTKRPFCVRRRQRDARACAHWYRYTGRFDRLEE